MKEKSVVHYVKRAQKNYRMCFKLQVVCEVERGKLTIGVAARKYGVQNSSWKGARSIQMCCEKTARHE